MYKTSFGIAFVVVAVFVVFILAISGPVSAEPKYGGGSLGPDLCTRDLNQCLDSCDRIEGGRDQPGSAYERCRGQCSVMAVNCTSKASPSGYVPSTNPTGPPLKGTGGLNPVSGGTPPPVGDGGTPPPKVPIGVHPVNPVNPINPVNVEQPPSGTGSGVTILEKNGKGQQNVQDLIKSWQQKVNDKNSVLYKGQTPGGTGPVSANVKSQIFNQSNQTPALGGSGKQKLQTEKLHQMKEMSNFQNWGSTSGASSLSTPNQHHGGHR